MKRTLFYVISGRLLSKTLLSSLLLLFLLTFGVNNKVSAQCIGPYQGYESGSSLGPLTPLIAKGWQVGQASGSTTFAGAGANGRSGRACFQHLNTATVGAFIQTPVIATPETFTFYVRKATAAQAINSYLFQFSDDGGATWFTINNGASTVVATYNTINLTATVPALTAVYQAVSVTASFPATPLGYRFRVTDNRTVGVAGNLWLDDFSWTSSNPAENTIIIPSEGPTPSSSICTVNVPTGKTLYYYDAGGDIDTYTGGSHVQDMIFTPVDNTYKIKATIEAFNTVDATDFLQLFDDATRTTQVGANRFGAGTGLPYDYTSTDALGSLSFKFTCAGSAPPAANIGYRIKIEAVRCAIPTAFNGVASSSSASLWWNSVEPNFDIHYNTTNTVPNAGSTVNDVVLGTPHSSGTPHVLTGLSNGTTYYIWVRSSCGAENSNWVGPVIVTTLCTPFAVTTSTPYIENFNGLNGPLPVCTSSDSPPDWATNITNGNLFSGGVSTSFFTIPLQLTAGQLYRVSYDYSGNIFGETSLVVGWGTTPFAPTSAGYTDIAYHGYFEEFVNSNIVNFTAPTTGTYYIRFLVDDITDPSGVLNLDNIKVEVETCLPPTFDTTSPTAPAVSPPPYVDLVDDFGATISWNLPVTGVPSNGYLYFISTTPVAPAFSSVANGSATGTSIPLTGLTPNTRYYVWVRSNCGAQVSTWSVRYVTFVTTNVTTPTTVLISQPQPASPTFTVGCNFSFFDSGGASGNYLANNETYRYTFKPTTAGSKLKVVFSSFSTEDLYDGLMIYSGDDTAGNAITLMSSGRAVGNNAVTCPAGAFSGTTSPGTIISTAANGSLTFIWRSDVSLLFPGWSANITCVTVPRVDSFNVTNNSCGTGVGSPVIITGFNFTGATGVFFGGVPASSFVINSGTQITAIIPAGAKTGVISVANATATGFSSAVFTAQAPPPVTTGASICPGGAGTITSSTDCSGFLNAVSTIAGSWDASNLVEVALRPIGAANSNACAFSTETRNYHAVEFQVSLTGTYVIEMATGFDGMGYITTGAFTPGSCATGTFIIGDDDSGAGVNPRISVLLTAGVTYTLYSTTWSLTSGAVTGPFTWTVTSTPIGGSVLLYVNSQIRWYSTNDPLSPQYNTVVATGIPFNPVGALPGFIPNTNTPGNFTYYAACSSNPTCRTATVFEIKARPTMTVPATVSVCSNIATPVTVTGDADSYLWSSSVAGTLFNNAAGDDPYVGANVTTVYVKATAGITITVVGTNATTLCTTTVTSTVALPTSTWDGVSAWTPVAPDATRIVVFDGSLGSGNFSSTANVSACSVSVINGATVLFNAGDTLSVQNAVSVAPGSTLEFDDRASLLQTNNVTNAPGVYSGGNVGNIIYKRNTTPVFQLDYTYWSMPVYPQTINGFSPTSSFAYTFNSSLATPAWQNTPFSAPLIPGKGYIVRAPSSQPQGPPAVPTPALATFNGVPNNGSISVPVYGSANQMNLIGNPYPSAIDIERFLIDTNNDPLLQGTVYLWTHNTRVTNGNFVNYVNGDYALFNFTGPLGTGLGDISGTNPGVNMSVPTKYIAAGQSFFIKGSANGTAVFNNSMRVAGNNSNFFRMADAQESVLELEKNRYWLDIYNANGASKQILVGYIETATNGLDSMFDGDLVDGAVISMYTTAGSRKLSIQGRALPFDVEEQLPLGYKSTIASSYTIRLSDFDGLFTSQTIYLEDKVLNIIHDLKASDYTFTTNIGTFEDRFVLRYTTNALSIDDVVFNSNSVIVYKNEEGLFVNTGLAVMEKVTIYDVRGRVLASKKNINSADVKFVSLPETQQVLLVRVEDQNGNVVTKKVVY